MDILCAADRAALGSTWGATSTYHAGVYYLFISAIANQCTISTWMPNSQIYVATSTSPVGPFCNATLMLPTFAHNPSIQYDKSRDQFTFASIGLPRKPKPCVGGRDVAHTVSFWYKFLTWVGINNDPSHHISIRTAKHPLGPWKVEQEGPLMADWWSWWRPWTSDPALFVHPNGTHYMAYKALDHSPWVRASVAMAWADCASCTMKDWHDGPLFDIDIEDPYVYLNNSRLEMLLHTYKRNTEYAVWHATAVDRTFRLDPSGYRLRDPWEVRQRPALLFDKHGTAVGIVNGARSASSEHSITIVDRVN